MTLPTNNMLQSIVVETVATNRLTYYVLHTMDTYLKEQEIITT